MYIAVIEKRGYMKYISHLDMVRLFRNVFKITGIKLAYSRGFNPHPKLSFALPLPLGYGSSCEALEFEVNCEIAPAEIPGKLNAALIDGVRVISCEKSEAGKSFASRVAAASYEICFPAPLAALTDFEKAAGKFMKLETITVEKKNKKTGEKKEVDIKKMIKELSCKKVDDNIVLYTTLDAGSVSNLSPDLLISAFISFTGIEAEREQIEVKRTEIILCD